MDIASNSLPKQSFTGQPAWSAVGAMAMCVALLIASEFMPSAC